MNTLTSSDETQEFLLDDTEVAFQIVLKTLNPQIILRGVLQSQLQSVLKDKTDISEQLARLREQSKIKLLSCKNYGLDDFFLMTQSQYIEYITTISNNANDECLSGACSKFVEIIKTTSNISINSSEFCDRRKWKENAFTTNELSSLVVRGLLNRKRDTEDIYYISHPKVGDSIYTINNIHVF